MPTAHRIIVLLILFLVVIQLRAPHPVYATSLNPSILVSLINLARTNQGIPPLHPDPSLDQAAANKAQALRDQNQFSHNVNQQPPWIYFDQVGYRYALAGENLAQGFSSETAVVEAWLNSPSHAANLLSPDFIHSGLGVATDAQNNAIVVHLLASPLSVETTTYNPQAYRQTPPILASSNYFPPLIVIFALSLVGLVFFRRSRPLKPAAPNRSWWRS